MIRWYNKKETEQGQQTATQGVNNTTSYRHLFLLTSLIFGKKRTLGAGKYFVQMLLNPKTLVHAKITLFLANLPQTAEYMLKKEGAPLILLCAIKLKVPDPVLLNACEGFHYHGGI